MAENLVERGASNAAVRQLQDEAAADVGSIPPSPVVEAENAPVTNDVVKSPLERKAVRMSKRGQLTRMRPSVPFVMLSGAQVAIGVVILGVGGAAFATTPSFRAGCFWAGLMALLQSIYCLVLLCLKLAFQRKAWFKKCKRHMHHALIALCLLCILVTITAAVLDILAAYMLHRTDFSRCQHTDASLVVDCNTPHICSNLTLPPNTCYCCYLYQDRSTKGCHTPFLLDKAPYFEEVESCDDISQKLYPMAMTVGMFSILSTVLNIFLLFKSSPVHYYMKNGETAEEGEEDEGKKGGARRFAEKLGQKWLKLSKNGKQSNVKYTVATTADTETDDTD